MSKEELAAELSKWWMEVKFEGYDSDADALATWLLGNFQMISLGVKGGGSHGE